MENNEEKLGSQEPKKSTKTNSSKKVNTKLIGIIAIAVIIILAVVLMFMTRGAKSTVKDFAKAIEKGDSNKMANLMDMTGMAAYESTKNDLSKFDEVYKNIKEDKEKQKELEEVKETYKNPSNTYTDSKVTFSIKDIKEEKVEGSKKLKKVTCTLKVKSDSYEKETEGIEFYVVKDGLKYYIASSGI